MQRDPAGPVPARLRLWSLSEDVLVEVGPGGDHLLAVSHWGEARIDDASPLILDSLRRMSLGPVSVENLPVAGTGLRGEQIGEDSEPWQRLSRVLVKLGNCVVQSLGLDGESRPLLSVVPVTRHAGFLQLPKIDEERPVRLSRFTAMQAGEDGLVLESPLSQHRVVLHEPVAAWVAGSLARPIIPLELAAKLKIAKPLLVDVLAYLVASGTVLVAEPESTPSTLSAPAMPSARRSGEDGDPDLVPWSPNDLLFHARTRMGRRNGPAGAVFPYAERIPAPPVTKRRPAGQTFPLFRPEPAGDAPAAQRRLAAVELGELLWRAARIRSTKVVTTPTGATYTVSDRPYLGTAGLYELEVYVSVDRCDGLPRGSYHYDPADHVLTSIGHREPELGDLLDIAKAAAGQPERPAVLITLATRMARLSWVYGTVAYATTLKHVGALLQTLQLTAGGMGLGSVALAVGDGTVADDVLRLDWPAEATVGELIVGDLS